MTDSKNEAIELSRNVFLLRQAINERVGKKFGISPVEVEILSFINVCAEATATDIERARRVKKNRISVRVENLVRKGYIERKEIPDDRRKVMLVLTDKAKVIASEYRKHCSALGERLSEGLTEEEKSVFIRSLRTIGANSAKLMREIYDK